MARRSPRVVDTKQRILDAALELFGERGYYAVGVDEIAARAGITKGALYYYFHDTADLARDLARDVWDQLQAEARQTFDRERNAIVNLKRGFSASLAWLRDLPQARFFLRDCRAIPELNVDADEPRAASTAVIRSILTSGIERGEIVSLDPDATARVLLGACLEATLHVLETGRAEAIDVVERFIDSLAAPSEAQNPRPRAADAPRSKRSPS